MAAITSNATGGGTWSSPSTWAGGVVPAPGDTVTIANNDAVTISADTVVGASPATGGTAAVAIGVGATLTVAGCKLTPMGDVSLGFAANLVVQPSGSTSAGIEFDPPAGSRYQVYLPFHARLQLLGTSSGRVYVRTKSGAAGQNCSIGGSNQTSEFTATSCDFARLGDSSQAAIDAFVNDAASVHSLRDCTFTGCGVHSMAANMASTATFSLRRVTYSGTVGAWPLATAGYAGITTGLAEVVNCSFDKTPNVANAGGFRFAGNYFHDGIGASGGGIFWKSFDGNLVRWASYTIENIFGDFTNNYQFIDRPSGLNPDNVQPSSTLSGTVDLSGNIFEFNGTLGDGTGDQFDAPAGNSAPTTYLVRFNLVLPTPDYPAAGWQPSGKLFGALGGANQTWLFDHNTAPLAGDGPLYIGDTYNPPTGYISSLSGNLFWDTTTRTAVLFNRHDGGTDNGNVVAPANCDYNALVNALTTSPNATGTAAGTAYACAMSGAAPGVHDLVGAAPAFVDDSRRLRTWGQARRGADGTDAGALAKLQADPTLIPDLIAWVRAGWRPTNAAYSGATTAFDAGSGYSTDAAGNALGGTPGAMAVQAPTTFSRRSPGHPRIGTRSVA